MKWRSLLAAPLPGLILALSVLAAPREAPRTTVAELERLLDRKQVVIVDVRSQVDWNYGHIKGARHIPLPEIEARFRELPKDKAIVTYCT